MAELSNLKQQGTLMFGLNCLMRRVASTPLIFGILTSNKTTSGLMAHLYHRTVAINRFTDNFNIWIVINIRVMPILTKSWSSTTKTLILIKRPYYLLIRIL